MVSRSVIFCALREQDHQDNVEAVKTLGQQINDAGQQQREQDVRTFSNPFIETSFFNSLMEANSLT